MTKPKRSRPLTLADVHERLRAAIAEHSSLRAYARATHCSAAYLSDVLSGRRDPGPKILKPLGLTSKRSVVITYAYFER